MKYISASKVTAILATVILLSACVVRERVYRAPPRAYYPPPVVSASVDVEVRSTEAPPPLPDYQQPPCPEEGYLWTPGYWHWSGTEYFWIPGTWVQPPRFGVLWTPGYWAFSGGSYGWHGGYWGPHVGFYGGVNYGFGYVGVGFLGGRWAGNSFAYNTSVNNVNTTIIHNTYNQTVINNTTVNKVSYNGGSSGVIATPTSQERAAAQETRLAPTALQTQHVREAVRTPGLSARTNNGHPAITATARPSAFNTPAAASIPKAAPRPAAKRPAAKRNPRTKKPQHE